MPRRPQVVLTQTTRRAALNEALPHRVLQSPRGEADFSNKLLSAMRYEFGGHLAKKSGQANQALEGVLRRLDCHAGVRPYVSSQNHSFDLQEYVNDLPAARAKPKIDASRTGLDTGAVPEVVFRLCHNWRRGLHNFQCYRRMHKPKRRGACRMRVDASNT